MFIKKETFKEIGMYDESLGIGTYFGALVYKHINEYKRIYPMFFYWILKLLKNIVGMLIAIITLNKQMLQYHYTCCKGKIRGIIEKRKEY